VHSRSAGRPVIDLLIQEGKRLQLQKKNEVRLRTV